MHMHAEHLTDDCIIQKQKSMWSAKNRSDEDRTAMPTRVPRGHIHKQPCRDGKFRPWRLEMFEHVVTLRFPYPRTPPTMSLPCLGVQRPTCSRYGLTCGLQVQAARCILYMTGKFCCVMVVPKASPVMCQQPAQVTYTINSPFTSNLVANTRRRSEPDDEECSDWRLSFGYSCQGCEV